MFHQRTYENNKCRFSWAIVYLDYSHTHMLQHTSKHVYIVIKYTHTHSLPYTYRYRMGAHVRSVFNINTHADLGICAQTHTQYMCVHVHTVYIHTYVHTQKSEAVLFSVNLICQHECLNHIRALNVYL